MSKRTLRPMAEITDPVPIPAAEVEAVGTLDGEPWHSDYRLAVAGEPPDCANPTKTDFDFDKWLSDREFSRMTPVGWFSYRVADGGSEKCRRVQAGSSRIWMKPGYAVNFMAVRYFRIAHVLGARKLYMRQDGQIIACRNDDDALVALVAPMRIPL